MTAAGGRAPVPPGPPVTAPALSRRRFLGGALSLPAAAWLAGCGGDDTPARRPPPRPRHAAAPPEGPAPPPRGLGSWSAVRGLFDLEPGVHHLSAYILAPHSQPVRDAIARHRRGLDRDPRLYLLDNEPLEEEAARAAARHLGTDADLVALTDSTTMGLGVVLGGMRLLEGEEVLTTAHEHYAAREALRHAAERAGARVREVELYPPRAPERATAREMLTALDAGIGPRTRAVVVTWVHSSSGIRLPLRDVADLVERANRRRAEEERALLVVDAAHALGGGPAKVGELGCDVLVAGCHKWLLGPRGTGIAWARREAWDRITPAIPSFDDRLYGAWMAGEDPEAPPGPTMTPGGYHSFEHRWALREAFALHERIGAERIAARIAELGDRLRAGLGRIGGVTLHAPRERQLHSGVVCFTIDGREPTPVVQQLFERHRVLASSTPYSVELVRLGTAWLNTREEVDAAIAGVRALAA